MWWAMPLGMIVGWVITVVTFSIGQTLERERMKNDD
jgi:hypothetical protein